MQVRLSMQHDPQALRGRGSVVRINVTGGPLSFINRETKKLMSTLIDILMGTLMGTQEL